MKRRLLMYEYRIESFSGNYSDYQQYLRRIYGMDGAAIADRAEKLLKELKQGRSGLDG